MTDGFTLTTPEQISAFQLLALRGALKLEAFGMKRRGESAFSIIKRRFGLKAASAKALVPIYEVYLKEQGILKEAA